MNGQNENLKNDDLYIVSYPVQCAENDCQLEKSKKWHLEVNLAPKLAISSQIWQWADFDPFSANIFIICNFFNF